MMRRTPWHRASSSSTITTCSVPCCGSMSVSRGALSGIIAQLPMISCRLADALSSASWRGRTMVKVVWVGSFAGSALDSTVIWPRCVLTIPRHGVALAPDPDADLAAVAVVVDRVGDEVVETDLRLAGVGEQLDPLVGVELRADAAAFGVDEHVGHVHFVALDDAAHALAQGFLVVHHHDLQRALLRLHERLAGRVVWDHRSASHDLLQAGRRVELCLMARQDDGEGGLGGVLRGVGVGLHRDLATVRLDDPARHREPETVPLPPCLVVKNGLKSLSTCSSGMPVALSETITIRHPEPGVSTWRVLDKMAKRGPSNVSSACSLGPGDPAAGLLVSR